MIKIVKAKYLHDYAVELYFSDGKKGMYDFSELLHRRTSLTTPLEDIEYFKQYFLELGAICWKNGLEFSPSSIYRKLEQRQALEDSDRAA